MKKNISLAVIIGVALTILPQPISAQEVGDEEEIEFRIDDDAPMEPGNSKTPVLDQFEKKEFLYHCQM